MTHEEAMRLLDGEVEPETRERLRSEVRRFASKQALLFLDEGRTGGITSENRMKAERLAFGYCERITSLIRIGCVRHRHLTLDFNLFLLLRDTLSVRGHVFLSQAIDRHAPDKQQATIGVDNWTAYLSSDQVAAIEKELRYETMPRSQVDEAYFDVVVTVGWLLSTQLLFVARSTQGNDGRDLDALIFKGFLSVLEAADFNMERTVKLVRGTIARAESDGLAWAITSNRILTDARLPGWVVTRTGRWIEVLPHLRERLPLQLQADRCSLPTEQPENWDWLCEGGGPLLICWGQFQVAQPRGYAEHRCRQLSAVCACLDAATPEEDDDELEVLGSDVSTVECRAINVPLNVPWAEGKKPFERGGLHTAAQSHVLLPRWPLTDGEHVRRLEAVGLREVLSWIIDGDRDGRVSRSLEAFETARSMGGRFGSLPPAIEEGWRMAALCSSLEQLFCTRSMRGPMRVNHVQEQVRRIAGDRAAGTVKTGFDRRNERVHENSGDQWSDFPELVRTVRQVLAHELRRAAGVGSST